jgi:hypothetical protein
MLKRKNIFADIEVGAVCKRSVLCALYRRSVSDVPEKVNSGAVTLITDFSGDDITRRIPLSTGAGGSELTACTAEEDDDGGLSSRASAARDPAFKINRTAATATAAAANAAAEMISVFLRVEFIFYLALKKCCVLIFFC